MMVWRAITKLTGGTAWRNSFTKATYLIDLSVLCTWNVLGFGGGEGWHLFLLPWKLLWPPSWWHSPHIFHQFHEDENPPCNFSKKCYLTPLNLGSKNTLLLHYQIPQVMAASACFRILDHSPSRWNTDI